ncbi:uncharacterized protein LOC132703203 [Cylas formicarius]|uniref:uncharacterized protein LOC132703203 n=1 Tax=Cylas formicarius TaxID=197179 RepID=UPI002958C13A|nr:uncharacterized protein LOC132703203 [Cylas formicarius]
MCIKIAVLSAVLFLLIGLSAAQETAKKSDRNDLKKSLQKNCDGVYSLTCIKLGLVSWVEKMNENDDYSVLPGVSIVRENNSAPTNTADIVSDLARDFPDDPDARLDAFVEKKISGFLDNHSIKLNFGSVKESAFTGRKKDKGGMNQLGALLGLAALMKGALMSMALAALAAIAGKALMTSLISLLLSALLGLKGSGGGGGHTTYEVVAKPVYTHSQTHSTSHAHEDYGPWSGGSGHGRSFDVPLPLGLNPDYKVAH